MARPKPVPPKSRERLNDFYDFCQGHAGEYNKGWNFYAGMTEGEVRAAQENEAMTGGRLDSAILRQLLIALAMIVIMLLRPRGLWPAPEHGKSLSK